MTVVVLGGGPGGLAAAIALVRGGRAAVVHEAGSYPRHRVCGEFLSPDALPALDALGLGGLPGRLGAPAVGAFLGTASRGGRLLARTGFPLEAPGSGLSRFDLDAAMADHARREGVEVRERARATSLPAGVSAVVVATGRGPRPGEGERPPGDRSWVGVKVHVRGVALGGVVEIHGIGGAYVGLGETACGGERVVNVCALVRTDAWDRAGRTPAGLWRLLSDESPPFAERWRGARVVDGSEAAAAGFGFRRREPLVAGRGIAVGYAAALPAPLSGSGQAAALAGGIAAARVLLGGKAPSFRPRVAVGDVLQRAFLEPAFASAALHAVAAVGPAASWLYRSTRGAFGPGRRPLRAAWRKSTTAGVPPAARTAVPTWPRW